MLIILSTDDGEILHKAQFFGRIAYSQTGNFILGYGREHHEDDWYTGVFRLNSDHTSPWKIQFPKHKVESVQFSPSGKIFTTISKTNNQQQSSYIGIYDADSGENILQFERAENSLKHYVLDDDCILFVQDQSVSRFSFWKVGTMHGNPPIFDGVRP
ncbi:MAG: hypothetical protein L3J21_09485 [Devosiaceae bacterium]|nr:hypothetical protein [Devosiaceae bacterium]